MLSIFHNVIIMSVICRDLFEENGFFIFAWKIGRHLVPQLGQLLRIYLHFYGQFLEILAELIECSFKVVVAIFV